MAQDLIITNFQMGISSSPHIGFQDMRNLDISSHFGAVRLNNAMDKMTASTITGTIKWIVRNPASPANFYAIDSDGKTYTSSNSGVTWTAISNGDRGGTGEGLAVWKDYLFVFETTTVDTYGPLSGSATWTDNWQTIGTATWHPTIVSKNFGNLYFGCGQYLGYVEEVSGQNFAPGNGATFTVTVGTSADNSLDLPEDYKIKCLEELGSLLMIGTYKGTNVQDIDVADIFPWDMTASTFLTPITIQEFGVHAMKTVNQQLFILAGVTGKVYVSNGVTATQIAQIPKSIANTDASGIITFYPDAIAYYKGKIFFGASNTTGGMDGMGVWSVLPTSDGTILNLEHMISSEQYGADAGEELIIGSIEPVGHDTLLIGWEDNDTYGIDLTDSDAYNYTSTYQGYLVTPFYTVGTHLVKRQFTQLEFQLARDIGANEGIKIDYKVALDDDWTNIGTYTTANFSGVSHHINQPNIPACEQVQLRVSLTGTTTTPHLKSITLR